jgi:hypothetical protein
MPERVSEVMEREDRIRTRRRGAVLCLVASFALLWLNAEFGGAKYGDGLRYALNALALLLVPAAGVLWWHASVLERSRP